MALGGSLIGALRVTVGLESAKFETGVKRVRQDVRTLGRDLSALRTGFTALISAGIVSEFAAASRRALDFAGGLGELAQQAGVSARFLKELSAAGIDAGVSQEQLVQSLGKLSRTIGEAQAGNKSAAATFRELGIDVRGLTAETAFPKLIASFERLSSPTDQARFAADLFGRSGLKLLPILNSGAAGFERARQEAHSFGLVLSDDAIATADAASDALARLGRVAEVNFARAIANSAGGVDSMAASVARLIANLSDGVVRLREFVLAAGQLADRFDFTGTGAGRFIADRAGRAAVVGLDNRTLARNARVVAQNARANPNDPNAREALRVYRDELLARQDGLRRRALNASAARAFAGAPIASPAGGGRSRGGRGGGGGRSRAIDPAEFDNEIRRLDLDRLGSLIDQSRTADERLKLEQDRLGIERQITESRLLQRRATGELTEPQFQQLRLATGEVERMRALAIDQDHADRVRREAMDVQRAALDASEAALRDDLQLATTQGERRKLLLALLAIETKRKDLEADELTARGQVAQADALRRTNADARQRAEALINIETAGPLEAQFRSMALSSAQIAEEMERAGAAAISDLSKGLADAVLSGRSLLGVIGEILTRLASRGLELGFNSLLGSLGGGGVGGFLSGLFGGGGAAPGFADISIKGLPKLAGGGSFMVGGRGGIDRNVLSVNGQPRAMVSANERVSVNPAGSQTVVQLVVGEGQMFEPRVAGISGNVSVQAVRGAARGNYQAQRQRLGS